MKNYTTKLLHKSIAYFNDKSFSNFISGLNKVKTYQIMSFKESMNHLEDLNSKRYKKLSKISYQDFRDQFKVTSYQDWSELVEKQRETGKDFICQKLERFQPTSGSTSNIKWIPYNKLFLKQINRAANTWLGSLYKEYPQIISGAHYWSLSWLPEELRGKVNINDEELFPWYKRQLMKNIMAVDERVSTVPNMLEGQLASLVFLCSRQDLALISVWSPTFFLTLLDLLDQHREKLAKTLFDGRWFSDFRFGCPKNKIAANILSTKDNIELKKLWPNLSLISSWDTGNSIKHAQKLQSFFPDVAFQGKGLWATEAVVTIPIRDNYLLAYQSHFYEFEDIVTGEILTAWELEKNMQVSPIITTGNGITRYKIDDVLEVVGHEGQCPALRFLGRNKTIDLVGEKLDHQSIQDIINKDPFDTGAICLIGVNSEVQKPYYLLLSESLGPKQLDWYEQELLKHFHYKLARESGQLRSIKSKTYNNPSELYKKICIKKGMIEGNIKIDPLLSIDDESLLNE